jgi:hypothetical protein
LAAAAAASADARWSATAHRLVDFSEATDAAVFVRPPFQHDDATVSRLHGYFNVGLSPTEAAQAFFC